MSLSCAATGGLELWAGVYGNKGWFAVEKSLPKEAGRVRALLDTRGQRFLKIELGATKNTSRQITECTIERF